MEVLVLPEVQSELERLPRSDRNAIERAFTKLEDHGDRLPFPHTSNVRGARNLRELRPRGGKSPWRAFYRRIGDIIAVAAVGSEAKRNPAGFQRAVRLAEERLAEFATSGGRLNG